MVLYDWPDGTRRGYLPVIAPHCLVATRQIRSERFRFGDMQALLDYWASSVLVQSVEMLALSLAWDEPPVAIECARWEVEIDQEMVRMIALAEGYSATEAEVWVTRALIAGKELAETTLREDEGG